MAVIQSRTGNPAKQELMSNHKVKLCLNHRDRKWAKTAISPSQKAWIGRWQLPY
ncbi:hypothetical protein [Microseira sp. BLCC-F43]|uniref:hypothetical protein n=1 Tax=Microseira sp. BLCC-F43 TaxID=3153602 RepID=UPI0035B880F9